MLDWPMRIKTWTGLVMSAGLLPGCSAAETAKDESASVVRTMDESAKAARVMRSCFMFDWGWTGIRGRLVSGKPDQFPQTHFVTDFFLRRELRVPSSVGN